MRELLRQPAYAAAFAVLVTLIYIHVKLKVQGVEDAKNSTYFKPAFMIAVLVYNIVYFGQLE
jgi:hypothetical protein